MAIESRQGLNQLKVGEKTHGAGIFASRWRQERNTHKSTDNRINHFAALSQVLQDSPDGLYLDIGCGSGYSSQKLATIKPDSVVIALDSTPEALALTSESAPANVAFVQGDAFNLPLSDGTVKASWTEGLIEHYPHTWEDILDEQFRVTEHGGLVITSVPNILNIPYTTGVLIQGNRFRYYPERGFLPGGLGRLQKKYNELGLTVIDRYGWGITYSAKNMYEWDSVAEEKKYPLYTKGFHVLGNILEGPISTLDRLSTQKLSKWIGFEFMLVGQKK